jgi:3-keto-5-aminohexanoate cleavage enzyme
MAGTPEALMHMKSQLPADCTWTVAGIGAAQLSLGTLAIVLGGHVRVGFEDNIFYRKGELAHSNAQLVARIARISVELGRALATPDEARAILGMSRQAAFSAWSDPGNVCARKTAPVRMPSEA